MLVRDMTNNAKAMQLAGQPQDRVSGFPSDPALHPIQKIATRKGAFVPAMANRRVVRERREALRLPSPWQTLEHQVATGTVTATRFRRRSRWSEVGTPPSFVAIATTTGTRSDGNSISRPDESPVLSTAKEVASAGGANPPKETKRIKWAARGSAHQTRRSSGTNPRRQGSG